MPIPPLPPHVWIYSIAASSALAGVVLVQFARQRRTVAGFAHEAVARTRHHLERAYDAAMSIFDRHHATSSSRGNRNFDDYRAGILRGLEDEQRDFTVFLDRLRRTNEREEFNAFLARRTSSQAAPDAEAK